MSSEPYLMTRSIAAQHAKEDGSSLSVDEQLCHAPQGPHMLFPRPSGTQKNGEWSQVWYNTQLF
jgi:hypothetical protein